MAVIVDGGAPELDGARGVHALAMGDRAFVHAALDLDDGFSAVEPGPDGSLASIQDVADDLSSALACAGQIASATVDGRTFILVADTGDDIHVVDPAGLGCTRSRPGCFSWR